MSEQYNCQIIRRCLYHELDLLPDVLFDTVDEITDNYYADIYNIFQRMLDTNCIVRDGQIEDIVEKGY